MAKIIVAMIFVVFALFGFGSITTFLVPVPKVASVNGDDITEQEMLIAVERSRSAILSDGTTSPADIDEDELRKTVLDDLVERKVLSQFVDDMGFFVSDSRLDQDIVNTPSFQAEGKFDADRFQLLLRSAGYTPLGYREVIREDRKFRQINYGISASEFVTPVEADRLAELSRQIRDVAYLTISVDELKKDVILEEGAVEQYYNNNVNDFVTEESVDLNYVEVKRQDLADEVIMEEADLKAFYETEKDNYKTPEERQPAHILIEVSDTVSEADAKARIDEIYARIKGGEEFAAVAKEVSEDPGSAQVGGDLGLNARGAFVEPFEEALFKLSVNQISEPVLSEFGYHLIKLLAVQEEVVPTYDELAEKLEREYRLLQAEEIFVEKSAKLSELAYESPDLGGIAAELDLKLLSSGFVGRSTETGIFANQQIMDAAFSPDLLVDGNNSDLIELDADHHIVVRVREHKQSQLQELSAVEEEIHAILVDQISRDKAVAQMDEALKLLKSGSITRYVADTVGSKWVVEPGIERQSAKLDQQILGVAFRLPRPAEGQKSLGSIVLDNGDAVVVSVSKVSEDETREITEIEMDGLVRFMESNRGRLTFTELRQGLKSSADIEHL
jgi:peptidyl-prolyl cis-trans isomerase D